MYLYPKEYIPTAEEYKRKDSVQNVKTDVISPDTACAIHAIEAMASLLFMQIANVLNPRENDNDTFIPDRDAYF